MNKNQNIKILIIDDQPMMRELLKRILKVGNFNNISEAASGEEAWETLKTESFDLLLLDMSMPGMHGMELLKLIRGDNKFDDLSIIIITAESFDKNKENAVKYGANGYLMKPFITKKFHAKIDQVLSAKKSAP